MNQVSPSADHERSRWPIGRICVVVLAVWLLVVLLGSRGPGEEAAVLQSKANREAASFQEFPLLTGSRWSVADHRGKIVVVNLWATWCPPCQIETPDLVQVAHDFSGQIEMLGVSMDQGNPAAIRRFVADHKVPYPIARGIGQRSFSLGIPLPTTYVLDRQGRVAIRTIGAIDDGPFRKLLTALIAERN